MAKAIARIGNYEKLRGNQILFLLYQKMISPLIIGIKLQIHSTDLVKVPPFTPLLLVPEILVDACIFFNFHSNIIKLVYRFIFSFNF